MTPAASTPAITSACVSRRCRPGVSHRGARATSQARSPVAVAPADIAPTMHCMHMTRSLVVVSVDAH